MNIKYMVAGDSPFKESMKRTLRAFREILKMTFPVDFCHFSIKYYKLLNDKNYVSISHSNYLRVKFIKTSSKTNKNCE